MPHDADERALLAEAYRNANASLAIEGLHMTRDDLALQQRVIDGEWSGDDLRAHVVAEARERRYRRAVAQELIAKVAGADAAYRNDAEHYIAGDLTLHQFSALVAAKSSQKAKPPFGGSRPRSED